MAENKELISGVTDSVIKRAVDKTPSWVMAFSGGTVSLSVCIVFVLQVGGFSAPLSRIMNAEATKIERAAERIDASVVALDEVMGRIADNEQKVQTLETRVQLLETRADGVDKYHGTAK